MLYQTVISWSLDSTYNQSVAREAPRTCPEERSDEGSFCKSSMLRDPLLRFGTRRSHQKSSAPIQFFYRVAFFPAPSSRTYKTIKSSIFGFNIVGLPARCSLKFISPNFRNLTIGPRNSYYQLLVRGLVMSSLVRETADQ